MNHRAASCSASRMRIAAGYDPVHAAHRIVALVQPLLGAGLSHRPGIRFIPITDPSILREIGMVVRRNARLPDPVVAFQNHVVENVPRLYEQAISGR